jgi:hypothetical protein
VHAEERATTREGFGLRRLYDALPGPDVGVGLVLVAGLMALYGAMELALGRPAGGAGHDLVGLGLMTLLLCLLLAYALTAEVALTREAERNARRIRPLLAAGDGEARALEARLADPPRGVMLACSLFGLAVSLVVPLLEVPDEPWGPYDPRHWIPETVWHRVLTPLVGWTMGRLLGRIVVASRVFSRLAERLPRVDLLDPASLVPFVRQGMAHTLAIVGFVALFSFYLIDLERYARMWATVGSVTVVVAGAGLLLPVRGVHRRLRAAKREELARVDAAIRGEPGALAGSPIASREGRADLADLVAWRGLVQGAHEWPFDASTLVRFALYLLIPLGSWSGGALVERLVDALLD